MPPGIEGIAHLGPTGTVGQVDRTPQRVVEVILHPAVVRRIEAQQPVAVAVVGQKAARGPGDVLVEHRAVVVEVLDVAALAAVVADAQPVGVVVVLAEGGAALGGLHQVVGGVVGVDQILPRFAAVGLEGGVAVGVVLVADGHRIGRGGVDHLLQPVGLVVVVGLVDGGDAVDRHGFGLAVVAFEGVAGDRGVGAAGQR